VKKDKDFRELNPFDLSNTIIVNPGSFGDHIEADVLSSIRKYTQFGRFIAQPTNSLITPIDSSDNMIVERISIPSEYKPKIRKELKQMGMCYETTSFREPKSTEELIKEITSFIKRIN